MESKTQTFKDNKFQVIKGSTHPEYSYFTFEQEEKSFREQYWNVKSGDIVFDVGASYGSYTLAACSMGAVVYAFEPELTVFNDLVNNVRINNWTAPCFLSNMGLWSTSDTINMKSYAPHWPQQTITSDYKMDSIDNIFNGEQISKLDWIKIDVEGAEEHVIKGGLETIKKFKPNIIVECHIFLDAGLKDRIKDLLLSICDYTFEEVIRPPCVMLCATPKT